MIMQAMERPGAAVCLAALMALAAWPGSGRAATVLVAAPIESAEFVDNLEPQGRQQAEAAIAAALVELAGEHFPLLDWTTDASAPHAAVLRLALVDKPGPMSTVVSLAWRGEVGGTPLQMPQLSPIPLYSSFQTLRETHDAAALASLVRDKLGTWFPTNSQHFKKAFIPYVPVASQAEADEQAQGILLPISLSSAHMAGESTISIRLLVTVAEGPAEEGEIRVSNLLQGCNDPFTLGRVQRFNVSGVPGIDGQNIWHPRIRDVLSRASRRTVFVEDYQFKAVPTDNTVLCP